MTANSNESKEIIEIPLDRIRVDANQPRKVFDEQKLRELASSMAKDGLIQPILVYRVPNEEFLFEIEEGERRFRAAALLNWQSIRSIIIEKKKSKRQIANRRIAENIHRENLSDSELALEFQARISEGQTQEQVAKDIGKSRSYVAQRLLILEDPSIFEAMQKGELSFVQAREKLFASRKLGSQSPKEICVADIFVSLEVPKLVQTGVPTDIHQLYDAYAADMVRLRKAL